MGDKDLPSYITAMSQITDREVIEAIIDHRYFADFGVITKVNGDNTVDVQHLAIHKKLFGTGYFGVNETRNIELFWPATSVFAMSVEVKKNDHVLLVGLRDAVPNSSVTSPKQFNFRHAYSKETLKAIPLGPLTTSGMVVSIDANGKMSLTSNGKSLYSVLDGLISDIKNIVTEPCSNGAPTTVSSASKANLTSRANELAQILKA